MTPLSLSPRPGVPRDTPKPMDFPHPGESPPVPARFCFIAFSPKFWFVFFFSLSSPSMGRSQEGGGDLTLQFHPGGIFWGISHPEFPAPRSRLSREKRFGKGSKFGICAAASSLENIPKPRGLFLGGGQKGETEARDGVGIPKFPQIPEIWDEGFPLQALALPLAPPRQDRGHLGATSVSPLSPQWDGNGTELEPSHPIPAPFPQNSRTMPPGR